MAATPTDGDTDREASREIEGDAEAPPADAHRRFDLHGVVVRYETGPNRCTVHPHDTDPRDRTTTWLSADCSAFVTLESMR